MNWISFHFSCRFLSQKLSDGLELKPAIELLSTDYSNYQPLVALTNPIYQQISALTQQSKQQELLSIYGQLKLNWDISCVSKLTNIRNYLFLIFGMFLLLSGIYRNFVLPTFQDIFSNMDIPVNAQLESFSTYWAISIVLMVIVSGIILKFTSIIKQINSLSTTFSPSVISKVVLSSAIVNQIYKIEALIYAPLDKDINQFSAAEIKFVKRLKLDKLNVVYELQTAIDDQYAALTAMLNSRIKKILCVLAIIVVNAIFNFVYSLYAPLFTIGTVI